MSEDQPNANFLEGLQCPRCRNLEPFVIEVTTLMTIYDSGPTDHGGVRWDDHSWCLCVECDFKGRVQDFESQTSP